MKLISGITIILTFFVFFNRKDENIVRMNTPSFSNEISRIIPYIVDFKDTIPGDTLFAHVDKNGIPVKYSRNIVTGVCIDGECRMVRIVLFWNITGRYLGFELPDNEFLSKTEHDPFNAEEYTRLHKLLSDSRSALAAYTMEELVPRADNSKKEVDAVSSATIAAVLDYIVEGAVYTTYTLWHITYGPTKRVVENQTAKILDADVISKILRSEELSDKIWALNNISGKTTLNTSLEQLLLEYIAGDDVYLAERSLNALKKEALSNDLQLELARIFAEAGFLQKRLILQKLKDAKELNPEVANYLGTTINELNGTLVKSTLALFKMHQIEDPVVTLHIANLLQNENRFIANQAYQYLEESKNLDKKTLKSVLKYKKKNL